MGFVTLMLAFLVVILLYLLFKSSAPENSTSGKKKISRRELTTENKSPEEVEVIYRCLENLAKDEKMGNSSNRNENSTANDSSEMIQAGPSSAALKQSSFNDNKAVNTTMSEESEKSEFAMRQTQHSETVLTYNVQPIKGELQRVEPCQTQIIYSQDVQTKYNTTTRGDMTDQNQWSNGREFR